MLPHCCRSSLEENVSQSGTAEDYLSDLPDCVLLHILSYLNTKDAIGTCLLSTRWRNLWKGLSTLTLCSSHFRRFYLLTKFVHGLLHCDGLVSLQNLHVECHTHLKIDLLGKLARLALCHNVQRLTIIGNFDRYVAPCIFSCRSLTFLKLSNTSPGRGATLPKYLDLPLVSTLHLCNVTFVVSDDDGGCAEPFSQCKKMSTLIIEDWNLDGAEKLCISNDKLIHLSMQGGPYYVGNGIVLFTPNLRSFSFLGSPFVRILESDMSFLEELDITHYGIDPMEPDLNPIGLLQLYSDIKSMTLSSYIFQVLPLIPNLMSTRPPCLRNLKSLRVNSALSYAISARVLDYLLKHSPPVAVSVIPDAEVDMLITGFAKIAAGLDPSDQHLLTSYDGLLVIGWNIPRVGLVIASRDI